MKKVIVIQCVCGAEETIKPTGGFFPTEQVCVECGKKAIVKYFDVEDEDKPKDQFPAFHSDKTMERTELADKMRKAMENTTFKPPVEKPMDFSEALKAMKQGNRVMRQGWNGKGVWIEIQPVGGDEPMSLPYLSMRTVDGNFVPWLASQTDLLSDDWWLVT